MAFISPQLGIHVSPLEGSPAEKYLGAVCLELFNEIVIRLEVVNFFNTNLTNEQKVTLFTVICQKIQLKKLYLDSNDLSSLKPETFAQIVTRLEEVNLCCTNLARKG